MEAFRKTIYEYYRNHGRPMPWRETLDPYCILVSEIMLQQTQVDRVREKYEQFINTFPDFVTLADSSREEVLKIWQGLGYNRRALSLKATAEKVVNEHEGILPESVETLVALPGIGRYTASAVAAFAFNKPVVFIETNIRTVFIHFFFFDKEKVSDRDLEPLVEEALDTEDPRNWYYALMDYGTMLKKAGKKDHQKSAHYRRQSPFKDSNRRLRGAILKLIIDQGRISRQELCRLLAAPEDKVDRNLIELQNEGFVRESEQGYTAG